MHAHATIPPPPCFTDEAVCLGSFVVPFFFSHNSNHLDKGSSLSHRSINTVAGGFQTLDFSMPIVFAIALIDLLFSFSIQLS